MLPGVDFLDIHFGLVIIFLVAVAVFLFSVQTGAARPEKVDTSPGEIEKRDTFRGKKIKFKMPAALFSAGWPLNFKAVGMVEGEEKIRSLARIERAGESEKKIKFEAWAPKFSVDELHVYRPGNKLVGKFKLKNGLSGETIQLSGEQFERNEMKKRKDKKQWTVFLIPAKLLPDLDHYLFRAVNVTGDTHQVLAHTRVSKGQVKVDGEYELSVRNKANKVDEILIFSFGNQKIGTFKVNKPVAVGKKIKLTENQYGAELDSKQLDRKKQPLTRFKMSVDTDQIPQSSHYKLKAVNEGGEVLAANFIRNKSQLQDFEFSVRGDFESVSKIKLYKSREELLGEYKIEQSVEPGSEIDLTAVNMELKFDEKNGERQERETRERETKEFKIALDVNKLPESALYWLRFGTSGGETIAERPVDKRKQFENLEIVLRDFAQFPDWIRILTDNGMLLAEISLQADIANDTEINITSEEVDYKKVDYKIDTQLQEQRIYPVFLRIDIDWQKIPEISEYFFVVLDDSGEKITDWRVDNDDLPGLELKTSSDIQKADTLKIVDVNGREFGKLNLPDNISPEDQITLSDEDLTVVEQGSSYEPPEVKKGTYYELEFDLSQTMIAENRYILIMYFSNGETSSVNVPSFPARQTVSERPEKIVVKTVNKKIGEIPVENINFVKNGKTILETFAPRKFDRTSLVLQHYPDIEADEFSLVILDESELEEDKKNLDVGLRGSFLVQRSTEFPVTFQTDKWPAKILVRDRQNNDIGYYPREKVKFKFLGHTAFILEEFVLN